MAFDSTPPEPTPPREWPPKGMWCNPDCDRCQGKTAHGKGEACNQCGRFEDGSLD